MHLISEARCKPAGVARYGVLVKAIGLLYDSVAIGIIEAFIKWIDILEFISNLLLNEL